MDSLELLLARADDAEPVLPEGLVAEALAAAPRPGDGLDHTGHLGDSSADPQDLRAQRWGIVVPEGPDGDRLLALVAPLRQLREEEQGAPAKVYRVPSGLNAAEALAWRDRVYAPESVPTHEIPRYLLLLGDLDALSLDTQQVLGADAFCGRLAFGQDAAYEAYADKVIHWRSRSAQAPRVVFHTVHDGTNATSATYRGLVKPALATLEADRLAERLPVTAVLDDGDIFDPNPQALLDGAKGAGDVLFTTSHGLGGPRGGWTSPAAQRERQGALVFGGGQHVEAADLAHVPFVPGGFWFAMACFGAGTPTRSLYFPWLLQLKRAGAFSGSANAMLGNLPAEGAPGFLSRLAQAALANPDGPLGVVGHVDLAWTFGFADEEGSSRASRFSDALRAAAQGRRLGSAFHKLYAHFGLSNLALSVDYGREEEARALQLPWEPNPARRARLWMQRQDLGGFVLLGDPAARLSRAAEVEQAEERIPELRSAPVEAPEVRSLPPPSLTVATEADWLPAALRERIRTAPEIEIEEIFEGPPDQRWIARRVVRIR